MAQSFIKDSKDYMRKEVTPNSEEKTSLEVQVELMKELRKYQAQAIDLTDALGTFQEITLKNTTKVANLIIFGLETKTAQDSSTSVSTEAIQRTIRDLVCNLTSDIFTRFEGQHLEFTTTLQ
jgi:F420-0:gamma-glutamyl ligase-like protein